MAFWNLRKKGHWKDAASTIAQGIDFGYNAVATTTGVLIDTNITTVRAVIACPYSAASGACTNTARTRINATDPSVIYVHVVTASGTAVASPAYWLAWGDL
jgi:hypothetical protein